MSKCRAVRSRCKKACIRKADVISSRSTINRRWLPLNALRAFEAVGQHLSFTGGAAALSVSQSAMSRHVGGLEELLGKQLFDRDASKLALTAAGEELLPVVSKCLDRLEQTMNSIREDDVAGRSLRLHVPPSLLQQLFLPMLRDFRAEHPDIRLDVSSAHVTGLPPTDFDMAIAYDRSSLDGARSTSLFARNVHCQPGQIVGGISRKPGAAAPEIGWRATRSFMDCLSAAKRISGSDAWRAGLRHHNCRGAICNDC
jgi:DNA-binding transcriptional LysR family regulator